MLVIADIHGNLDALDKVLDVAGEVDKVLCIGDIVGYGAQPNESVDRVKDLKAVTVMGNHDLVAITNKVDGFNRYAVEAIHWTFNQLSISSKTYLANLPARMELNIEGHNIYLVHGSPDKPLTEYVYPPTASDTRIHHFLDLTQADILILGHTHIPFGLNIGERLIFNPGSVGQPRDNDPRASYAILEIVGDKVNVIISRVSYDIEQAATRIKEAKLPSILAERLFKGL